MVMIHGCGEVQHGVAAHRRGAERAQRMGIVYGLALAGLGVLFLLAQFDVVEITRWWRWWPILTAGWGLSRVLAWTSADDVGSGVSWILLTGWFLVSSFEWFGLDWATSWPLVLVAIGGGMVTTALLRPHFRRAMTAQAASADESHA